MARSFKRRPTGDSGTPADIFDQSNDFFVGLLVTPNSPAVGCTVEEAGLRTLKGVYLALIRRDGRLIHTVRKDTPVQVGDVLYFSGTALCFVSCAMLRRAVLCDVAAYPACMHCLKQLAQKIS